MKNFALIGAAGYIAPRHMKAIKDTGNQLVAAVDKHDCVGMIDSYFPQADFFTEFERLDRHIEKFKREPDQHLDFVSICTPNYLHDAHVRAALNWGAHAICEKPLVLNPWNLDALEEIQRETGKNIYTILQLRYHPSIIELKKMVEASATDKIYNIDLTYITSRGKWYFTSWKGDLTKSGGIATNIGVHFFDMLSWVFGDIEENIVHQHTHDRAAGILRFKKANVRWFLSINSETLPESVKSKGQRTFRAIEIDGEELEFSDGFTELHTRCYEAIFNGSGYTISDTRQAIEIVHKIRSAEISSPNEEYHPFIKLDTGEHPFKAKESQTYG